MNYFLIFAAVLIAYYLFTKFGASSGASGFTNLNGAEAKTLVKEKNASIIDVRTPGEVNQGKIKGAKVINVTSPSFSKEIAKLDKTKPYLVYCRSGNRSARACSIMKKNGFEELYNLKGGYGAWN